MQNAFLFQNKFIDIYAFAVFLELKNFENLILYKIPSGVDINTSLIFQLIIKYIQII